MPEPTTPLMRQYGEIKKKYPEALLFFRLGDFYELFYEDAVVAARELQITLTSRNKERGEPVPMCGVPYHAADTYLGRLIRKGYKVAVCEQMESPKQAKKLVRREVTRVVTPGTAADAGLVAPRENNFLVASCRAGDRIGLACVDVSTGEFRATEFTGSGAEARLAEELDHLAAREIVFPAEAPPLTCPDVRLSFSADVSADKGISSRLTRTPLDDWAFGFDYAERLLREQFRVHSLDGFGLEGRRVAIAASGGLLHYLRETQQGTLAHLDRIAFYERQQWMVLDSVTVRNLELTEPLFAGAPEATLLAAIDGTATAMGGRLLKSWIVAAIARRGGARSAARCRGGGAGATDRAWQSGKGTPGNPGPGTAAEQGDARSGDSARPCRTAEFDCCPPGSAGGSCGTESRALAYTGGGNG